MIPVCGGVRRMLRCSSIPMGSSLYRIEIDVKEQNREAEMTALDNPSDNKETR
jgi:hypothetical protein